MRDGRGVPDIQHKGTGTRHRATKKKNESHSKLDSIYFKGVLAVLPKTSSTRQKPEPGPEALRYRVVTSA